MSDGLFAQVQARARAGGMTVSAFIQECVRVAMQADAAAEPEPFRLVTFGGTGPTPGVDLDRTSELLAAEDETTYSR